MKRTALIATGAYFAAWPLAVASAVPCIPLKQKQWIEGRLGVMGRAFGLPESQVVNFAKRHVLMSAPSFHYSP